MKPKHGFGSREIANLATWTASSLLPLFPSSPAAVNYPGFTITIKNGKRVRASIALNQRPSIGSKELKMGPNNLDSMMQHSNQCVRDADEGFGPTPFGRKGGDALAGSGCASDRKHRGAAS